MNEETIKQLRKVATPKTFSQDEYICYEGELGNEMYIILKGSVGIYVTNAAGSSVEVSTMNVGDFFGEMAIFDKLPRSASCIALEDTICVAIDQSNLIAFICQCPEIAEKILEKMSRRIRKLNDDLYKNTNQAPTKPVGKFEIPEEYGFGHVVKEPYQEPRYFSEYKQRCPVCGKEVNVTNMKKHLMSVRSIDTDGRTNYLMCDPLWHEVTSCRHCHYSNYNINFFNINPMDLTKVKKFLTEEYLPLTKDLPLKQTPFDGLVVSYLVAIHINKLINGNDIALIGTLWLYLYWLVKDSGDSKFANYCATNAIEEFKTAIDEDLIDDATSKYAIALSLANLLSYKKMYKPAKEYSELALDSLDDDIQRRAQAFRQTLPKEI